MNTFKLLLIGFLLIGNTRVSKIMAQVYPPDAALIFQAMPTVSKPAYLIPITDPVFNTKVVRIGDQATFNTKTSGLKTTHLYSKDPSF